MKLLATVHANIHVKSFLISTYKERSVMFAVTGPKFGMVSSSLLFSFINAKEREREREADYTICIP